ncbi:MAG: hypothetical protein WD872_20195 [Pirellulaceae bacterium]
MIHIAILDQDGKAVADKDSLSLPELRLAATKARELVRECDRLAQAKEPKPTNTWQGGVPYRG